MIADNDPYHHKRAIGSLSKNKLVEPMKKHKVDYIEPPLTARGHVNLYKMEGHEDHPVVHDRSDSVRISFYDEE